jgi:hypothetical protein
LQNHMQSRCPQRTLNSNVPKKAITKAARSGNGYWGQSDSSDEEMQRIFEAKMVSGGRYGSSRQH